ncbi:MAG: M48 family metallopeptidase [Patescibacteria group bacterium]
MVYAHLRRNRIATVVLVAAFLCFIVGVAVALSYAQTGDPYLFAVPTLFFALFYILIAFAFSKQAVLAMSGAKRIEQRDSPELYRTLENLAISKGLPTPKLYLIDDTAPNAFATGIGRKHAAVAVTTGLLQKLSKQELEGVLAHELAHIEHGDTRLMTLVVLLVGVITLIADFFLRSLYWSGGRSRQGRRSNGIFLIVGIVLALLSPFIAQLLKLAISRKREFYADAEAALTTRYPEGLASALEKIAGDQEVLEVANHATAHLYIENPFKGEKRHSAWHAMFSTHPAVEERIKRLREMMT